jgi:DNA-binding MarR family transcriptional regulator
MPNAPEAHLAYWLRFVSNHVSQAFGHKLQARDVTVAEWVLLRSLYDQPSIAPSELAERLGLTRGAISKLTGRLEEKAFVVRTSSTSDRRYQVLALTPGGRALVPELAALADDHDAEFFGHLSPEHRTIVADAMKGIVQRHSLKGVPVE